MLRGITVLVLALLAAQLLPAGDVEGSQGRAVRIPHKVQLRHPGINKNLPLEYTLYELLSPEGVATGYTLTVDSVLCESGDCQVCKVEMFWDVAGGFVDYSLAKGAFLEKASPLAKDVPQTEAGTLYKGVPFTGNDYQKLDAILSNKKSILREQQWGDLAVRRKRADVDAVTTATPAALSRAVVKGAALTCFHLWHWAQGDVGNTARELTHRRCDKNLLQGLLGSEKPHQILFALEHLSCHKIYDSALAKRTRAILQHGDNEVMGPALIYLANNAEDDGQFGAELAALYIDASPARRIQLVGVLGAMRELPASLLEAMGKVLVRMDRYYEVHLFLSLLEKHEYASGSLLREVSQLLDNGNFFIARRAYWYLKKQSLDNRTAHLIEKFRRESEAEGRILE